MGNQVTLLPAEHQALQVDQERSYQLNPAALYLGQLQSQASKQTMQSFLNSAAKWLEQDVEATWKDCRWVKLNRIALIAYVEYLHKDRGLSLRTVRTALAALRGVAREAWLASLMPENEYRKIKEALPRINGHKIAKGRALSKDELSAMFNACRQRHSIRGLRDEAIIGILALCGLRREELVKLNYEHIDWNANALIFIGKGSKERVAFMAKTVQLRLHEWCERVRGTHDGALFFGITRGEIITEDRLTVQGLHYIVTKLADEAEIERCTAHDLRRTYATLQFESNIDILTVRDNMGHASVTTTQIYDHRDMTVRRESTAIMEF